MRGPTDAKSASSPSTRSLQNRPTSYAPILLAAGVMLTLWGVASTWIVSIAGLIVIAVALARWRKDIRHEN